MPKSLEQLVEEAIEAFGDPVESTTNHVRRAIRIATKRQDYLSLIRLLPDTFDLSTGKASHRGFEEARANLTALLGKDEADRQGVTVLLQHQQSRQKNDGNGDTGMMYGQSIAQLEALLDQCNEVNESYKKPPENLTPIDTYFVARSYDAASAKLLPQRQDLKNVIERVKQSVYDFLIETERQIELGQRRPQIFDRGKEYVERALKEKAPAALEKFEAAENSLDSGAPETLAHALTSCRRMMKALADALYPADDQVVVGVDGRERTMSDDAYRNRLLQFATDRLAGTHGDLIKEVVKALGNRLQRLNELSSKGVHNEVTRAEAETCILWTYLTAADLLRIADGTALNSFELLASESGAD